MSALLWENEKQVLMKKGLMQEKYNNYPFVPSHNDALSLIKFFCLRLAIIFSFNIDSH